MKGIQIILVLCLFTALYCDGKAVLNCVINKLDDNIVNTVISKYRNNPDNALSYLTGKINVLLKAFDSCI